MPMEALARARRDRNLPQRTGPHGSLGFGRLGLAWQCFGLCRCLWFGLHRYGFPPCEFALDYWYKRNHFMYRYRLELGLLPDLDLGAKQTNSAESCEPLLLLTQFTHAPVSCLGISPLYCNQPDNRPNISYNIAVPCPWYLYIQFPSSSPQVITRSPRPTRPQGCLFSCELRRQLIRVRHLGRFTLLEGPAALLLGSRVLGPVGGYVHPGEPADK